MIITEFESVAHRDYYAKKDPAHMLLATSLPPFVKGLQVLDIAAWSFEWVFLFLGRGEGENKIKLHYLYGSRYIVQ
jgi:hypothetical protein